MPRGCYFALAISLVLLLAVAVGCGRQQSERGTASMPTPAPTPHVEATVSAQVAATMTVAPPSVPTPHVDATVEVRIAATMTAAPPPAPTPNVEATVAARVAATMTAAPPPAPTPNVEATVAARVAATMTAAPPPTPSPVSATPTVDLPLTGLGYSLGEVTELAREMGFLILRRDDRVILEGGPVAAALFPPYDNLSKVWLHFDVINADMLDVVDATALIFDSLVKTRFEEVPAISHICALPYVGVVYGTETVYCTPARVRLF